MRDERRSAAGPAGRGPQRIGIIGSGMAGSFSAHFAREVLGAAAEIVVFERQPRVGGRVRTLDVRGLRAEGGASLIHSSNRYLLRAVARLGLHHTASSSGEKERRRGELGIWDGHAFGLRTSTADLPLLANLIRRYGRSLWRARRQTQEAVERLLRIYDEQREGRAFATPEDLHRHLDLYALTQRDGYAFFRAHGIGERFAREFSDGVARSNYGQDGRMNAYATLISLAGGGLAGGRLSSVREGNVRICEGLLGGADARVRTGVAVRAIAPRPPTAATRAGYLLRAEDGAEEAFDAVVVAAPLESAELEFRGIALPESARVRRPYQVVHVTFVVGRPRPAYFGLAPDSAVPSIILTRQESSIPFSSIGALGPALDGQRTVYKVFSPERLDEPLLDRLFSDVTEPERLVWRAYPVLAPTAAWPPFRLGRGLYYANAMESAAAAMELEAIAARNVINLLATDLEDFAERDGRG